MYKLYFIGGGVCVSQVQKTCNKNVQKLTKTCKNVMENEEILGENKKLECSFNFMPFVTDVTSAVFCSDIKKFAVHLIRKTTMCISFGVHKSIRGHKAN